jgi:hypothetical protein
MSKLLHRNGIVRAIALSALLIFSISLGYAQGDSSCVGYTNIKQKKVTGIAIGGSPGTPRYVSLLQYTPKEYNPADFAKTYPVLIYFPGSGTASGVPPFGIDPCRLIYDQPTTLPAKIADGLFRDSVFSEGTWKKFIVLSFQYNSYAYPSDFPSAASVDSILDYVILNYRADPNRIYLTGMSAGANIAVEYGASSVARAKRVAAVSISSTCSQVGVFPNSANAGANIAAGGLATRFISCNSDDVCSHSSTVNWVNAINAAGPSKVPELIVLTGVFPTGTCEGFRHNSWNKLYDSAYRFNGRNLLEWNIQFSTNSIVPVKLESFTARLSNGKVFLNWTTSLEVDAASFTIEKAGKDQQFSELTSINISGPSNRKKEYSFIDDNPQAGINYYRLVQTDKDGNKEYFEVRKVLDTRSSKTGVVVLPNPIKSDVTAFLNLSKAQTVAITLTDMNGRILKTKTAKYSEGSTGVTMATDDLPKGIYFLRTAGEDFTDVKKLIKQ